MNIDATPEMVSGYDKDKVGEQTVTVTFDGKCATFDVTVTNSAPTPSGGGISTGALVGGIIGGAVGGAAIALAISFLIKNKKQPAAKKINLKN